MDVILKPRILISVLECIHDRAADDETARDHVGQVKRDFTRTRADRVETRHGLVIGKTKFITGKEFNDSEKFPYSMTPDRKFGVMAALPLRGCVCRESRHGNKFKCVHYGAQMHADKVAGLNLRCRARQERIRATLSARAAESALSVLSFAASVKLEKPIPSRLRCTAFTERCPPDEENRTLRSDFQPRACYRRRFYTLLPSRRTLREPPPRRHYAVPWQ